MNKNKINLKSKTSNVDQPNLATDKLKQQTDLPLVDPLNKTKSLHKNKAQINNSLKKFLASILLFCIGALSSALYFIYSDRILNANNNVLVTSPFKQQNLNDKLFSNQTNNKESMLLNTAADMYHLALFSNKILKCLKNNLDYAEPLSDLVRYTKDFEGEIQALESVRLLATTSNSHIIAIIDTLPDFSVKQNSTNVGWWNKFKESLSNFISVTDTNDDFQNSHLIINSSLKEKIYQGNFFDALNIIKAVGEENNLNEVVQILKARVIAQEAATKIFNFSMETK